MKKYLLVIVCALLGLQGMTAKIVIEDIEIDGFIYTLSDLSEYYTDNEEHLRGVVTDLTDQHYDEFCETHNLCFPSYVEYHGNSYEVFWSDTFFTNRDFTSLETIIVPHKTLSNLNDLPNLKSISGATSVGGCYETLINLPALQELNLSTCSPWWDGQRIVYPRIRNSFINIGVEQLRYSDDSVLGLVEGSFNNLPNLVNLTLCYIEDLYTCFQYLPKLEEITFERAPRGTYGCFVEAPILSKITFKKWNPENRIYIPSNSFLNTPFLKDIYVEEIIPCELVFSLHNFSFEGFFPQRMTLHVPVGSRELYAAAEGWKDFGKIVEYDAPGAGIETAEADAAQPWNCTSAAGAVTVSAGSAVTVEVVTPAGAVVKRVAMGAGETVTVELPAGVYIVAGSGQSAKVCVR